MHLRIKCEWSSFEGGLLDFTCKTPTFSCCNHFTMFSSRGLEFVAQATSQSAYRTCITSIAKKQTARTSRTQRSSPYTHTSCCTQSTRRTLEAGRPHVTGRHACTPSDRVKRNSSDCCEKQAENTCIIALHCIALSFNNCFKTLAA